MSDSQTKVGMVLPGIWPVDRRVLLTEGAQIVPPEREFG